jgi:hypothetical protein
MLFIHLLYNQLVPDYGLGLETQVMVWGLSWFMVWGLEPAGDALPVEREGDHVHRSRVSIQGEQLQPHTLFSDHL